MSGGGGGTSTTSSNLPDWAMPYVQSYLQRGNDLSNQPVPQYNGQMVAGLSGTTQQGISNLSNAANNASGIAGTAGNWANRMAGATGPQATNPYTGNVQASTDASAFANPANNPYLAGTVAAANKQITDAYSNVTAPTTLAQFRNGGAFGGSAQDQYTGTQQKQLADALAGNTAGMYNSAYNTAANTAVQNAAQQNNVNLANQSVGTNANQVQQQLAAQNYFGQGALTNNALANATGANNAFGALAGQQSQIGQLQQQNSQDQLNAAYQQWYNQVNAPYAQLSTLSNTLSGALGSGAGTSVSQNNPGLSNNLGTAIGAGSLGLGLYNAFA